MISTSDRLGQKTFENADADNTSSQLLLIRRSGQLVIEVFKDWIYWEGIDDDKEKEDEYEPEGCSKTDNGENTIEQRRQK